MKNTYSNTDRILASTLESLVNDSIAIDKAKAICNVSNSIIRHEVARLKSGNTSEYWDK